MQTIAKILATLLLFSSTQALADLSFTDITNTSNVGGPSGADAGGHGAMWADVTGDGLPDLYMPFNMPQTTIPDYFYRNLGNGVFTEESQHRGIDDTDGGSHGACWADVDNDGDFDLLNGTTYIWNNFDNHNDVFRNNGNGFFSRVTGTSLDDVSYKTRAIIAFDMDSDGDLDILAISGYLGSGEDDVNELHRNDGVFQFTRITSHPLVSMPAGQGATDTDFDGDGDIDIFAANRNGDVNILRNDGSGGFSKITPSTIGIFHRAADGITTADVDNDGDLDLLLASGGSAELYFNNGSGYFTHHQSFFNPGAMGGFADLDNDGDLDLLFPGRNTVYLNDGIGNFSGGPSVPNATLPDPRAVSFADIDNDGDIDFLYSGKTAPNKLFRNNLNSGNWLKTQLIAENGQMGAFGAKVFVYSRTATGEDDRLIGFREAKSNEGYLVQNDPDLHFGLGKETYVNIRVQFLDGKEMTWKSIPAGKKIILDAAHPNLAYTPSLTGLHILLLKD